MKNIWAIPPGKGRKKVWETSTQKPIRLLNRIIRASTKPGDFVLDPFVEVAQLLWPAYSIKGAVWALTHPLNIFLLLL